VTAPQPQDNAWQLAPTHGSELAISPVEDADGAGSPSSDVQEARFRLGGLNGMSATVVQGAGADAVPDMLRFRDHNDSAGTYECSSSSFRSAPRNSFNAHCDFAIDDTRL
jgi:hypothetical protein